MQRYCTETKVAQKALAGLDWMPGYPAGVKQRAIVAAAVAAFADDARRRPMNRSPSGSPRWTGSCSKSLKPVYSSQNRLKCDDSMSFGSLRSTAAVLPIYWVYWRVERVHIVYPFACRKRLTSLTLSRSKRVNFASGMANEIDRFGAEKGQPSVPTKERRVKGSGKTD